MSDTIAAIATGSAVSAIGIVRISGPDTIKAVDSLFKPYSGKLMSASPSRKLVFGDLCDTEGNVIDICLCTISHGPNSYTGEDTAEFQCHGSPVLLRTLLDELFTFGIRQAGPGEFTKRAFLNNRLDLISAEAVADLIDAENKESVINAAGQLGGTITKDIDRIYSLLGDISSHYHAVLDYPDEDIDEFLLSNYKNNILESADTLRKLLATYDRGKIMKNGVPTAIIGLPNAGKSSLLNALLGYERAIVTNIAGTTRDTIEEKVNLSGTAIKLIDTAGIHDSTDEIELMGVQRSLDAIKNAELVLAVIDGTEDISLDTLKIIKYAEAAPSAILLISKSDSREFISPVIDSTLKHINISSVTGEGINILTETVHNMFPLPASDPGGILTNSRHADAIKTALSYLNAALDAMTYDMTPDIILTETEGAMSVLGELNGRSIREDITNKIFSRFCVGK